MKRFGAIIALVVVLAVPIASAAGTAKKAEDALRAVEEAYGDEAYGDEAYSDKAYDDEAYGDKESAEVGVRTLARTASAAIQSGVSAEEIEVFVREAARSLRSPKEIAAYIEIASTLHSEGVPPGLVFDAGLEGFARGVLETEMRRSIDALRSRLLFCRTIARRYAGRGKEAGSAGDMLMRALCYTMNMGFTEGEVAALGVAAENAGLDERAFFNVLRTSMELLGLGIDPAGVAELMVRSVRGGTDVRQIARYPALVREGRENGLSDGDIYESLFVGIEDESGIEYGPSGGKNASGSGSAGGGASGSGGSSGGGHSAGGNPGGGK
jgi:hypothetical protein